MANTTFSGPVISTNGFVGSQVDSNGNEVVIEAGVASAVNEITVTNAATGNPPSIIASGTDTNIGLTLSAKGTGSVTLWTGAGTREALILVNTASAVNEFTMTQAATGNAPSLAATGGDANIAVTLAGKGTGAVQLGQATSTGVVLVADQSLDDSSGNEYFNFVKTASAVNEFTVTNAATATSPILSATGGDTNISLKFTPKGTGQMVSTLGGLRPLTTVTTDATAGAITYTAAQMLGGLILRDTAGANRADLTPTAALLVAAVPGAVVGTSFEFTLRQTSGGAETITLTAGVGVTVSGTATVGQNNSKRWLVVFDNVTGAAEAVTIYSLGTVVT